MGARSTRRRALVSAGAALATCGACTLLDPLSGFSNPPGPPPPDAPDGAGDANRTIVRDGSEGMCPCTMFGNTFTGEPSHDDTSAIEVGVRFRADVAGKILGLLYYRGPLNLGQHTGSLWTEDGTLLASVIFTNETAVGWQHAELSPPVPIKGNTWYIASYRATQGHYAAQASFFGQGYDAPPLHAAPNGGLFAYAADADADAAAPTETFMQTNYWVDVAFTYD